MVLSHVQVLRFSPSLLYSGGEWTSVVLTQKILKTKFKKKREREMFTALSTLLSSPFSISVCLFLSLHVSLASSPYLLLSLSRSQDMQMTRGLARQSDSAVPRSARER